MFWKNGTYYKGMWVNGIQHGEGTSLNIKDSCMFLGKASKKDDSIITSLSKFTHRTSFKKRNN